MAPGAEWDLVILDMVRGFWRVDGEKNESVEIRSLVGVGKKGCFDG